MLPSDGAALPRRRSQTGVRGKLPSVGEVSEEPFRPKDHGELGTDRIKRWYQTLKNRILLENYYLPGDLEASIGAFVELYYHHRYHESLGNLTPADVFFGRDRAIIERRRKIKKQTFEKRPLAFQRQAA